MWHIHLVLVTFLQLEIIVAESNKRLSITQRIEKSNYPVENHTYETQDGYILTAFRIPYGIRNKKSRYTAVLVHGMTGSAENFVFLDPPNGLAFYLADRGYDVWLFNARGTTHSRKHRSLNPNWDSKEFWNFSWHEIAVYDLPATINYILNQTGAEKLFYVGHSQGTTVLYVMLSEKPEMNEKIAAAAQLAPSVYISMTHSPFIALAARFLGLGQRLLSALNWHELLIPNSPILNNILLALCKPKAMQDICMDILYTVGGTESGYVNKSILPIVLQYSPSAAAVRQAWHYGQVLATGEFKKYDYGPKKNQKLYNDTKPPKYNLSNAKVPMALFYSAEDPFGNPDMIDELSKMLPNVALKHEITAPHWNHIDYIMAYNAKEVVYDVLFDVFKKYG